MLEPKKKVAQNFDYANRVGAQFYITYGPAPHLNGVQTVVGKVLFGWDVLDKMERVPVKGKKYRPTQTMLLERVTVHANPFAEARRTIPPPEDRFYPADDDKGKTKKEKKTKRRQMEGDRDAASSASAAGDEE